MADRYDPSQHPVDYSNDNDDTFYGDSSIDNVVVQEHAEGAYADPADLVSYIGDGYSNVGQIHDNMDAQPGKYNTRPRAVYQVAKSRTLPGASGSVVTAPCLISGWAVRETSGTASATLRFRDGLDSGNPELLTITLAPSESARDFLTLPIETSRAVYLEVVTGTVAGNLFTVEERYV